MFEEDKGRFPSPDRPKALVVQLHSLTIRHVRVLWRCSIHLRPIQQTEPSFEILGKISSMEQSSKDPVCGRRRDLGGTRNLVHFERSIASGQKFKDVQRTHENGNEIETTLGDFQHGLRLSHPPGPTTGDSNAHILEGKALSSPSKSSFYCFATSREARNRMGPLDEAITYAVCFKAPFAPTVPVLDRTDRQRLCIRH